MKQLVSSLYISWVVTALCMQVFEYRMMVIGFSFYITVKKKSPGGNELKRYIKNKITPMF